ncbi:MAG TPA: phosphoribosylglycinamide formyltransferase [Ktedonobacterales bacterium]|nr:phosphoribosylglycinamide formyltransferase [Ktedonobacterales bacterium]
MSSEQPKVPEIAVMVSGRGSNLDAIFRAIERGDLHARITLVISSRADAPALDIARQYGTAARVISPKSFASRAEAGVAIVAALQDAQVNAVALAGYKPILDASVIAAYPNRILNVHPSLLPAFAGGMAPKPQTDALAAGVKVSGCTVHIVTTDVDAGPIVAQAAVPVLDDDTVESLSARILVEEHRILPMALEWLLSGRLRIGDGRTWLAPAAATPA